MMATKRSWCKKKLTLPLKPRAGVPGFSSRTTFVLDLVGCESVPEEGGKGRGLQDCDQEPRAHHRPVYEAKQHHRHIRGSVRV